MDKPGQENREKVRYSVYVRIGNNTLSISGDTEVFVKGMINEFKEPFFQSITSPFAERPERGVRTAHETTTTTKAPAERPATPPDRTTAGDDLRKVFRRATPRTGVDKILLYLYHIREKGPVRAQIIANGLRAVGVEIPKAFYSLLGHIRKQGYATLSGSEWKITDKGIAKIKNFI